MLNTLMNINGNWFNIARLNEETLYSSPYLVANHQGYTKHYYAGSERIASCIGQGGLSIIDQPLTIESNENWTVKKSILNHQMGTVFGDCLNKMFDVKENGLSNLYDLTEAHTAIMDQYFYHPDHLGSTSWITDGSGNAIQYMHYLPYGEAWIDQQSTSWNAPYTFTGKIKDAETGYNYFGARYYDSQLSVWLSVDPMSDQYPSLSPYTYCANNPVMMVDPDGKKVINYYTKVVEFYQNRVNSLNKLIENYSGDKTSEEYDDLVKNRDDHVWDLKIAQDLETKVNGMIDKFREVMPKAYWDKVDNLKDKHGKSVDLVVKLNSSLVERGLFYTASDGDSFFGTLSDDIYTDMMQGQGEAPNKRSEQLIEIRKFWDVAALAHEFGHAFYNVTNPEKNLLFNQGIPPESRDGHQYGNPSGEEAFHWENVYKGIDTPKY